jgi:hypothetical protein
MLVCADGDVAGWSPRCRRIALVIISSVARYLAPGDMKAVYQQVGAGAHVTGPGDRDTVEMSLATFVCLDRTPYAAQERRVPLCS